MCLGGGMETVSGFPPAKNGSRRRQRESAPSLRHACRAARRRARAGRAQGLCGGPEEVPAGADRGVRGAQGSGARSPQRSAARSEGGAGALRQLSGRAHDFLWQQVSRQGLFSSRSQPGTLFIKATGRIQACLACSSFTAAPLFHGLCDVFTTARIRTRGHRVTPAHPFSAKVLLLPRSSWPGTGQPGPLRQSRQA